MTSSSRKTTMLMILILVLLILLHPADQIGDMNLLLVEAATAGIQMGSKSRKLDMKAGIMDQEVVVVQFRSRTMRGGDHLRLQTLGLRYLLASPHWVSYLLGGFAWEPVVVAVLLNFFSSNVAVVSSH
jgi:hypothetical protein